MIEVRYIGAGASAFVGSLLPDPDSPAQRALMAGALTFIGGATGEAAGLDGVTAAQAATNEAVNNRQLHRDERQLAARLAAASGGKYTQAEIEDAMRVLGNQAKDETVASGMVVRAANWQKEIYDDGARWIPGADGQSLVQVLPEVRPEVIAYVQQETGGWASPYAPPVYVVPPAPARPGPARDRLTGLPLDERGRYTAQVIIDGKVYEPKYWPCATAECLARNANLDQTDPGTQAFVQAIYKKALDEIGKAAAGVAVVNPVGIAAGVAVTVGTASTFAKGAMEGDLRNPLVATGTSEAMQRYMEHVWHVPPATAVRINALIDLAGGWDTLASRVLPKKSGVASKGEAR